MFIKSLFTVASLWKNLSVDGWMDKKDKIYIFTVEYYSALKRQFCYLWQHGYGHYANGGHYANKPDTEIEIIISIICLI